MKDGSLPTSVVRYVALLVRKGESKLISRSVTTYIPMYYVISSQKLTTIRVIEDIIEHTADEMSYFYSLLTYFTYCHLINQVHDPAASL